VRKQVSSSDIPAFVGTLANLLPGGSLLAGAVKGSEESPYTLGGGGGTRPSLGDTAGTATDIAGLTDPDPKLNPVIREHLNSSQRGALADSLEQGLNVGDNLLFQWRVAPEFWMFGRSFEQYVESFEELKGAVTPADKEFYDWVNHDEDAIVNALRGHKYSDENVYESIACYAAMQEGYETRWSQWQTATRSSAFGQLINNQPQIVFTYRGTRPAPVSGPRVDSYAVSLEFGVLNSLTWFDWFTDGWNGDCDSDSGFRNSKCAKAFGEFVEAHDFAIGHDIRFAASYEWGEIDDLEVSLPLAPGPAPPTLPITVPGTESTVAGDRELFTIPGAKRRTLTLGLGGAVSKIRSLDDVKRSSRLDLVYQGERFDAANTIRSDRKIWRLTYTYRVGAVSIPFNLLYRDRAEYDVDAGGHLTGGLGVGFDY
jgi:hypothetical protein